MAQKPTYQELEQMIKKLEEESVKRKQAEESLIESEEKFRLFFENNPEYERKVLPKELYVPDVY